MSWNGHATGSHQLSTGLFVLAARSYTHADVVEQACLAEELGFSKVLLAERHLRHGRLLHPSPFVLVAAIAAQTTRIRVGTAGRILSLDHPIRVAEDAATLDVLSGGRLELGLTRASLDTEAHAAFDSPVDSSKERFAEALEILVKALSKKSFSYAGTHFQVPEVSVFPKPIQRPHPPISIVAVSPDRLLFAAERGFPPVLGALSTATELEEAFDAYQRAAAAAGHNGGLEPTVNRFVYVSESDESARAEMEACFRRVHRRLRTRPTRCARGSVRHRDRWSTTASSRISACSDHPRPSPHVLVELRERIEHATPARDGRTSRRSSWISACARWNSSRTR